MRIVLLLFLMTGFWQTSTAQMDSVVIKKVIMIDKASELNKPFEIGKYMYVSKKIDSKTKLLRLSNTDIFESDSLDDIAYFRFVIQNINKTDTLKLLLLVGKQRNITLNYEQDNFNRKRLGGFKKCQIISLREDSFAFLISIPPNVSNVYYLSFDGVYLDDFTPQLANNELFIRQNNQLFYTQKSIFGFLWIVIGISIFLSIIGIVMVFVNREPVFIWWSCYLIASALFFISTSNFIFNIPQLPISGTIVPLQHLIILFYTLFISSFFNFKNTSLILHRASTYLQIFIFLLFIVSLTVIYSNTGKWIKHFDDKFFFIVQIWFLGILMGCSYLKLPQRILIISGSAILIIFSVWAVCVDVFDETDYNLFHKSPIAIAGFGFLLELIFLLFALVERVKSTQKAAIDKNNSLNIELSELQQKIFQTEITALRAQMNPHFIFNCLNSIQLFTAQNEAEKASEYLSKFSRLIRLVLENSRSEKVTLENELETLRLYIEMEAMRFKGKVSYHINIAEGIDTGYIQIPPLLVQPFVENAIWHGLMHKEEGGMVNVEVTQPNENLLHIEITDDGIGREKAAEFKSKSATINKSFGMKVTNERIELINQLYNSTTKVQVFDLNNQQGEAAGTKVVVEIPI